MRNRFTSRLSLLILSFAVAMIVFPAVAFAETVASDGTTGASLPTIQSDKADYAPGDTVTLTGSDWQAGESVNINVNDTDGALGARRRRYRRRERQHHRPVQLPTPSSALYNVTATGDQSGTVTTTFTDSNLRFLSSGPTLSSISWQKYSNSSAPRRFLAAGAAAPEPSLPLIV